MMPTQKQSTLIIDFPTLIPKFDKILERGLCNGVGIRDGQMCIEAAICASLDLPHGDDPKCVEPAVQSYKITLNDSNWSSPKARAAGLRDLGIAQISSLGTVDGVEFSKKLAEATIRVLIPDLFRLVFSKDEACLRAALRCEKEGTAAAARAAAEAAARAAKAAARAAAEAARTAAESAAAAALDAVWAAGAAAWAALAAAEAAAEAAGAAAEAAAGDKYLLLSASLALQVLKDLKSPGCEWLSFGK